MAFIDEIKEKAGDVCQIAGKKVGEAYSLTKVKMAIVDKRSGLRTLYKELGEITYQGYKNGAEDINAIEDKVAEIDLALEGIEELKVEYRKIRNIIMCPACHAEIEADSNFCPKCGEEIG